VTPKGPGCKGCPAEHYGVGFVAPTGPRDAQLCVVGQGPGEMEARNDEPFYTEAPSGGMLTKWLYAAGFQRSDTLLTNLVWCWLPERKPNGIPQGNRNPRPAEIAHCRRVHLDPLLRVWKASAPRDRHSGLVSVGIPAQDALFSVRGEKYIGTIQADQSGETDCGTRALQEVERGNQ
jgi:uracil-DNA glycosylase family 4